MKKAFIGIGVMILVAAGAMLAVMPTNASIQETKPFKIGLVDVPTVVAKSKLGQATSARVQGIYKQKSTAYEAKGRALQQEQNELMQQRTVLSEESFNKKKNDLEQRALALRQEEDTIKQELATLNQKEQNNFSQKLAPVIEAIGKEMEFTIIMDRRNGVYYFDKTIDITDQVITRLDASTGDVSK